jgi:hypothetical protein
MVLSGGERNYGHTQRAQGLGQNPKKTRRAAAAKQPRAPGGPVELGSAAKRTTARGNTLPMQVGVAGRPTCPSRARGQVDHELTLEWITIW